MTDDDDDERVTPAEGHRISRSNIEELLRANVIESRTSDVRRAERERREASRLRDLSAKIDSLSTKLEVLAAHIGELYSRDADDTGELRALRARFDTLHDRKPMKVETITALFAGFITMGSIAAALYLTVHGLPVPAWLLAILVPAGTIIGSQLPQMLRGKDAK